MADSTASVIESQLDWLTASTHTRAKTRQLYEGVSDWLKAEEVRGCQVRPFRLQGYVGLQCGRVRWGEKEAAGLVQLSGDLAREHFQTVWFLRDTLTRLDLAVTAQLHDLDDSLASRHEVEHARWRETHPTGAKGKLVRDSDHGSTFYVGDRTADFYLRCYNKQREAEARHDEQDLAHYQRCWRYELELKGPVAAQTALTYSQTREPSPWVQAYVHSYASSHGLCPIFPQGGGQALVKGFRRRSDRDSRLRWLGQSVAPTVRWLLASGDRAEVLRQLGLSEPGGPDGGDTT